MKTVVHESIESMELMKDGSTVSFAEKTLTASSMHLSWHDVFVKSKHDQSNSSAKRPVNDVENVFSEHLILDNAYGIARPGEVVAILGPSGAGKTSLLNVLTQRNCADMNVSGSVKVNGVNVTKRFMKKVCAYVQQDDLFIGSLTVEEHLHFMARLRMGRYYSVNEQNRRVREVMNDMTPRKETPIATRQAVINMRENGMLGTEIALLGLNNCAKAIIGTRTRKGISGGEKKRLAFASEILTSPPILICDEPTSGLDAFLAYQVICVLKELAKKRRMTILLTIHQPSSQVFQLFDSVYIMCEGRVAFSGNQEQAEKLWRDVGMPVPENFNPCDHYLSTLSYRADANDDDKQRKRIMTILGAFDASEQARQLKAEIMGNAANSDDGESAEEWKRMNDRLPDKKFSASFLQQLGVLTWRASKTVIREPTLLKVQIFQSIVIALLTGLMYTNNDLNQKTIMNVNGALYQMVTNMAFMFQFSVVHHFCLEMNAFYRESASGLYRVSAYFLAKNIAELPSYALSALLFTSILYWMSGLVPLFDTFLIYVLVGLLIQNIAISIGYFFSCALGTVNLAVAVMPIFVVPMMAFGGFFINQASLPIFFVPLKYLSYFGYAYESVAVNQWTHVDRIPGCSALSRNCTHDGDEVLDMLNFSPTHLWTNMIIMGIMIVVFRVMAFVALLMRAKSRQ